MSIMSNHCALRKISMSALVRLDVAFNDAVLPMCLARRCAHHCASLAAEVFEPAGVEHTRGVNMESPGRIEVTIPDISNRCRQAFGAVLYLPLVLAELPNSN